MVKKWNERFVLRSKFRGQVNIDVSVRDKIKHLH